MEDRLATAHLKGDVEWQKAVGQPKLTGESSRLVPTPRVTMPGQLWWCQCWLWWYWSLGAEPFLHIQSPAGKEG